jgi:beta-glucosidase
MLPSVLVALAAFVGPAIALMPWQDPSLPITERVADLVGRLNLTEQIMQTWSIAPAIPALGINAYNWRSNCLHGWAASGGNWLPNETWTVFPEPMGMGATWDRDLIRGAGRITAVEGRALHNLGVQRFNGSSTEARGVNCFSPNVRTPRQAGSLAEKRCICVLAR